MQAKYRFLWGALGGALLLASAAGIWLRLQPVAQQVPIKHCALPSLVTAAPYPDMVRIPDGRFTLGDTVYAEEQPLLPTTVQGFWMDRTEVTNAQFEAFVSATSYVTLAERPVDTKLHPDLPPQMQQAGAVVFVLPKELRNAIDPRQWWQYRPGANWRHPGGPETNIEGLGAYPVAAVTYEDALAYAHWKGRDLPTEAEWEWAARGGAATPPGNTDQPIQANTWQGKFPISNQTTDGFAGVAPVGCFEPNGYGLYDMIGNVWELTRDLFHPFHSPADNRPPDQEPVAHRPGSDTVMQHVIKGGSYLCAPNYCMRYRAGARQGQEDDLATSHLGFRTVLRDTAKVTPLPKTP